MRVEDFYSDLKTLSWGIGWGLLVLFIIGFVLVIIRRNRPGMIILIFIFFFYLLIGSQQMYFARFILPIVPSVLVISAFGLSELANLIKVSPKISISIMISILIIINIQPILSCLRSDWLLTQPDTRTTAKNWIEANLPKNSRIAVDWPFLSPPLGTSENHLTGSSNWYDQLVVSGAGLADHSIDWYQEHRYQFLITSNFVEDIPLVNSEANEKRKVFYKLLNSLYEPLYTIYPCTNLVPPFIFDEVYGPAISLWERGCPGPIIQIYQIFK